MLRNIISILSGSVAAQVVSLIAAPIITRIYMPDEFGMMATVWSIISIGGGIACLGYERTIVIEHDPDDAHQLVILSYLSSLASAFMAASCIYLFDRYINSNYFNAEYISLFVFLGVWFFGTRKSQDFYATREKRFHLIAVSILLSAIVGTTWKICAGTVWSASAEMLLLGNIIGLLVATILLFWYSRTNHDVFRRLNVSSGLSLLKRYIDFPRRQVPNALLNEFQQQAPIFVLAAWFGSEIVGFYGLAMVVLLRPVRALAEAVSRVYLQRVARVKHPNMHNDLIKATGTLAILAAPFCMVLFFFSDILFRLVFGEVWEDAGRMASLMAPWVFILVVKVPVTQTLIVRRALRFILFFNVIYLVMRVSGLVATLYLTQDVYSAILVFSLIGFFANLVYISRGLAVATNG